MSDALQLTIPIPPSINHLYATVRGRRMLSEAGRAFKREVGIHVIYAQAERDDAWRYSAGDRLSVNMTLYFPNHRRRDLDNTVKITLDSLAEPLGFDDCCVDILHVERRENDKERPRCEVRLEVLNDR